MANALFVMEQERAAFSTNSLMPLIPSGDRGPNAGSVTVRASAKRAEEMEKSTLEHQRQHPAGRTELSMKASEAESVRTPNPTDRADGKRRRRSSA
jgi:hypothetical protein